MCAQAVGQITGECAWLQGEAGHAGEVPVLNEISMIGRITRRRAVKAIRQVYSLDEYLPESIDSWWRTDQPLTSCAINCVCEKAGTLLQGDKAACENSPWQLKCRARGPITDTLQYLV